MGKLKSLFLIGVLLTALLSTTDASGQIATALRSIGSKAVKETTKVVGKKKLKKSVTELRHFKKAAKTVMKQHGLKSYMEYSTAETKKVLKKRMTAIKYNDIQKQYNSPMAHSIKDGSLVVENGLKNLPKGKEALKYKWGGRDKGYTPVYKESASKSVNQHLLAERRRAISPHNQFPTNSQLKGLDESIMEFGKPADAAALRRNLFRTMEKDNENLVNAFGGVAAHHVVPGNDSKAKASRKILEKFKIDINSPENGILLPENEKSIFKGTFHKTGHSDYYIKYVYTKLKDCKSREEVVEALQKIKYELYEGKLMLEGSKGGVNKNIRIVTAAS